MSQSKNSITVAPLTDWAGLDGAGVLRHRAAIAELLAIFKKAYAAKLDLPLICPLPALQAVTDAQGIPFLSVMAGITHLVWSGDMAITNFTHAEAVSVMVDKRGQKLAFTGVKRCAWCRGQTLAPLSLEHAGGTDLVCQNCASEYEYLTCQTFYHLTAQGLAATKKEVGS